MNKQASEESKEQDEKPTSIMSDNESGSETDQKQRRHVKLDLSSTDSLLN
jgi:hypothetical protein